ncbi:uncharacterized protein LOC121969535 [Zingiber officinale]|uniref:DUF3444 domain-containing protein n=1 Tax=Zingiber officinale TaxID=94328 RepID=A0A8J5GRC5_ZINOF|nr:uncharacterized protein LOC121969535 [Zingiber officinale]KAG6513532.1 hypothetical protein ZIOFF_023863 [Zingiber officinale]
MVGDNAEISHAKSAIFNKIHQKDYSGARALILEALKSSLLFDHASELLAVCDILFHAETESYLPHYGIDWYLILQLGPSPEPSEIHARYSILVSQLNRVKNDLPGTELALNYVKEAYSVLSNPVKRAVFDSKRSGSRAAPCRSNSQFKASYFMDAGHPVVIESKVSENTWSKNGSSTLTNDASEDATDYQQKKNLMHVSGSVKFQESSNFGDGLYLKLPDENESSQPQSETRNMTTESNLDFGGSSKSKMSMRESSEDDANQQRKKVCIDETICIKEKYSISQFSSPARTTDSGGSNASVPHCKSKLSANDFKVDQVWAVYDERDAMPRSYAKVTYIVSPCTVCVAFLEPNPMLDEEIRWVEENLPCACGIFRVGREAHLDISRFSHRVNFDISKKKSFYRIFPKEGEIWALYRNWNKSWRSSDFLHYKCRVVEILSDFSESGISIRSLVEVDGYMTFFTKQLDDGFQLTKQLNRVEMLSFSHRIPAYSVVDIKNNAIPQGSWHLEPDALPPRWSIPDAV